MRAALASLVAASLSVGCQHATKTRSQEQGKQRSQEGAAAKKPPSNEAPASTEPTKDTISTSRTTKEMFKTDGLKKMQRALAKNVPGLKETGQIDAPTQEALSAFQKKAGLPDTGLPDFESLRQLKMKPDELYEPQPPAQKDGVP